MQGEEQQTHLEAKFIPNLGKLLSTAMAFLISLSFHKNTHFQGQPFVPKILIKRSLASLFF